MLRRKTIITSNLHDPDGVLGKLARAFNRPLQSLSETGLIIAATRATNSLTTEYLQSLGTKVIEGDGWGRGRLNGFSEALKGDCDWIYYFDFDKLLHWLKTDPAELENYLTRITASDVVKPCRSARAWESYPRSWTKTERLINEAYFRVMNIPGLDVALAETALCRRAAEIIAREAVEESWGACGEQLLLLWKKGLKIEPLEIHGLTWEDPDRLRLTPEEIVRMYDSEKEWTKRRKNAAEVISVLDRFQ